MSEQSSPANHQTPTPVVVTQVSVTIDPQPQPQPQPRPLPSTPSPTSNNPLSSQTREEFVKYGVPLYQAAMQGNWEGAEQILNESPEWIREPIGKGGERVLHIATTSKHIHFVKKLIIMLDKDDLALKNNNENTALCFAATSGVVDIAKPMVEKDQALPNIRGNQGMTPLQMAVLLGHRDMVWYLVSVTDDHQLTDHDRIALLTSSINTDLFDFAMHIVGQHPNIAILRNRKGETALHALARKPLKPGGHHQLSLWKRFIRIGNKLVQETQEQPIQLKLVQILWGEIIKQEEKKLSELMCTPWRVLFVAAKCGNVEFLATLIRSYPDIVWKVDEDKRSIFHIAITYRHEEIFKLIYEIGAIKELIAIEKDGEGNNMLHLAGALPPPHRLNCVSGAALQMQRELLWFSAVEKVVRPEYAKAENKNHKTPHALFTENHEKLRTKGEEWMKKTAESCTLVATLIATVVFAAAFTLPGGTDSNTGNPVLVEQPLFIVFAICNAISLFSSSASILMFLSILTSRYAEQDFLRSLPLKLMAGLTGLFVSIATMTVAFSAAFFITFRKSHKWIPIPIAFLAVIPITFFAFPQFPLLLDIYRSTYISWSLFEPRKPKLFSSH